MKPNILEHHTETVLFDKQTTQSIFLPLSTIFPKRFFPLKKFFVEQFHQRLRNWYWHSCIAKFAPFLMASSTPVFSLANLLCFRLRVPCTEGSMKRTPGDTGDRLLGSPAFAMPLKRQYCNFKKLKDKTENYWWLFEENLWTGEMRTSNIDITGWELWANSARCFELTNIYGGQTELRWQSVHAWEK